MFALIDVCQGRYLAVKCLKLAATNNLARLDKEHNSTKEYEVFNFAATSQPRFLVDFYFPPALRGRKSHNCGFGLTIKTGYSSKTTDAIKMIKKKIAMKTGI